MQKSGHGLSKTEWIVALSLPSALFFFLLFLLFHSFVTVNTQDMLNRLLGNQIFLHLFLHLTIFCIGLFFLNQQPVKLLMQSLTGRNLLPIQLITGLLCRLMEHQLVTMFFKELFAVPGLAVCFVGLSGLGVIIDVRLQCSNLNHPFLSRLNGIGKFREARSQLTRKGDQILIAVHAFFFQKAYCPGSFFTVVFLCPAFIPNRFSFRHLGLNINEKMELLLFRSLPETTLRLVQTFPGDNGTEFFFTISLAKGTQTNISLLFLSTKRKLFSILKLESLIGKSLNKIFKALRFLFEYRVDSFTKLVTLSSLFRENRSFLTLSIRLRCDDGKPVFCAYTITQPLNRQTGKEEVVELPGTANRCRIINDVIVYRGWDAGNWSIPEVWNRLPCIIEIPDRLR